MDHDHFSSDSTNKDDHSYLRSNLVFPVGNGLFLPKVERLISKHPFTFLREPIRTSLLLCISNLSDFDRIVTASYLPTTFPYRHKLFLGWQGSRHSSPGTFRRDKRRLRRGLLPLKPETES